MKLVREHISKFERGLDPKDAMQIGDVVKRKLEKIQLELLKAARILVYDLNLDPKTIESKISYNNVEVTFDNSLKGIFFIGYDNELSDLNNKYYAGFEYDKANGDATCSYYDTIGKCMQRIRTLIK
jgi:hypothetical protein